MAYAHALGYALAWFGVIEGITVAFGVAVIMGCQDFTNYNYQNKSIDRTKIIFVYVGFVTILTVCISTGIFLCNLK